jgi:putative nucleotidyltransferase with HDIG domain
MSDPIRFLNAFAHALAAMSLYAEGHPARARAVDAAYRELADLQAVTRSPQFTFLGEETVYGQQPLRDLKAWDWGRRLALAGIQRLEFDADVGQEDFDEFLNEVLARLTLSTLETSEARQMRRSGIRFGEVGLRGDREPTVSPLPTATIAYTLHDEAETLRWLMEEVRDRGTVPLVEAEAVVRSLTVAMHGGRDIVLPLLQLKEFDQYTTTHSLNVAVLAMGLAEYQGLPSADVRAFGIAGLLHDIGKIRIPLEVLTKPGKFTDEERALMNQHPVDGARIIMETEGTLDLAAVVAYEHHILLDGSGYPPLHYRRDCHPASKLVHVCDVYDALRTHRPYRDAWDQPRVLAYLEGRAGVEFDPELVRDFVRMMREWESRVAVLPDKAAPVPEAG